MSRRQPLRLFVVDASVWVSSLVSQEIHHVTSRNWLAQASHHGHSLVAPVLLMAEVTAAITRRTNQVLGQQTLEMLAKMPNLRLVALDKRMAQLAAQIAIHYRLRGADAFYVALAYQLNAPLVTWDNEQLVRTQGLIVAQEPTLDKN